MLENLRKTGLVCLNQGGCLLLTLLTKEKKVLKSSNDIITGLAVILGKEPTLGTECAVFFHRITESSG